jgi:hypothetical protein
LGSGLLLGLLVGILVLLMMVNCTSGAGDYCCGGSRGNQRPRAHHHPSTHDHNLLLLPID